MSESTSNAASPTTSPHRLVGRTQQCPANNTRCSKVDTNVVRQGLGRRHHRRLPVRPAGPYRPRDWPVPVRRPATAWGTGPTRNRAGPRYRSKIYALWYIRGLRAPPLVLSDASAGEDAAHPWQLPLARPSGRARSPRILFVFHPARAMTITVMKDNCNNTTALPLLYTTLIPVTHCRETLRSPSTLPLSGPDLACHKYPWVDSPHRNRSNCLLTLDISVLVFYGCRRIKVLSSV